jgi:hypothetical protein
MVPALTASSSCLAAARWGFQVAQASRKPRRSACKMSTSASPSLLSLSAGVGLSNSMSVGASVSVSMLNQPGWYQQAAIDFPGEHAHARAG